MLEPWVPGLATNRSKPAAPNASQFGADGVARGDQPGRDGVVLPQGPAHAPSR
jgi:hypothetical protein